MKPAFVLAAICISFLARAQNLVPNSSFEDINICTEYQQPCSPAAWFFVRRPSTQGYISIDNTPSPTGNKHLKITVLDSNKKRQYWQCKLLCELQAGMKYNISIKVASPDTDPNLNDVDIYFTDSLIFSEADTILQPKEYLSLLNSKVRKLKNNWFELNTEYIATGRTQFLIIGNFSDEIDNNIIKDRKINRNSVSMLVDDISVIAASKNICPNNLKTLDSLYAIHARHTFKMIAQPDTIKEMSSLKTKIDTFIINNILFDLDNYRLSNSGSLDYLEKHFKSSDLKEIIIYGYTDNSGTEAHNKTLSLERATEVGKLIASRFGVPASIIRTEGKGVSGSYSEQAKKRRVEIYICHY